MIRVVVVGEVDDAVRVDLVRVLAHPGDGGVALRGALVSKVGVQVDLDLREVLGRELVEVRERYVREVEEVGDLLRGVLGVLDHDPVHFGQVPQLLPQTRHVGHLRRPLERRRHDVQRGQLRDRLLVVLVSVEHSIQLTAAARPAELLEARLQRIVACRHIADLVPN